MNANLRPKRTALTPLSLRGAIVSRGETAVGDRQFRSGVEIGFRYGGSRLDVTFHETPERGDRASVPFGVWSAAGMPCASGLRADSPGR